MPDFPVTIFLITFTLSVMAGDRLNANGEAIVIERLHGLSLSQYGVRFDRLHRDERGRLMVALAVVDQDALSLSNVESEVKSAVAHGLRHQGD